MNSHISIADPGFPVTSGGRQLPRRLRFEKFVCQNERIWTRGGGGGGRAPGTPPGSATDLECRKPANENTG